MSTKFNALDQALDIAGSLTQNPNKILTDETVQRGQAVTGQTGATASVTAVVSGVATITGLTGMGAESVGRFLTLAGADSPGNNGTFLIVVFNSATSVDISNASAVAGDANNGSIIWTEREPYSLEDDLNFVRTDRAAIKGVAFDAAIPTFERPTAVGTPVAANLATLAGKTTDAKALVTNRGFDDASVVASNTFITITSVSNLPHADATDRTGVPVEDGADSGNLEACYVEIFDSATGAALEVQAGPAAGNRIFGITRAGGSVDGDSVEVHFYSVPTGSPISLANPYTWEAGQPTVLDLLYPFRARFDQMSETAFRTTLVNGVIADAGLYQEIVNLRKVISDTLGSEDTDLGAELTNTGNFFTFVNLPDGTPSVVEALNTINEQIGNRTYSAASLAEVTALADGQTITASIEALALAIAASSVTRYIDRVAVDIDAGTPATIPGGATYILDGTDNGRNMWVFWRGLLKDPGPVIDGNDYEETSTTTITPYTKIKAGDHINYLILQ